MRQVIFYYYLDQSDGLPACLYAAIVMIAIAVILDSIPTKLIDQFLIVMFRTAFATECKSDRIKLNHKRYGSL